MAEDHLDEPAASDECLFSSIARCEFLSPADKRLCLTSEYFSFDSITPQVSGRAHASELDDCDSLETTGRRLPFDEAGEESRRTSSRTALNRTFAGERKVQARPKYRNDVSPAIQKIIRMMRMPCLSTPNAATLSPTKGVSLALATERFSQLIGGRLDDDKAATAADDDSICIVRRCLDASFGPEMGPAGSSHASCGRTTPARRQVSRRTWDVTEQQQQQQPVEAKQSPPCVHMVRRAQPNGAVSSSSPEATDRNHVSELYLLLMTSSRNRRMKNAALFRRKVS